MNKLPFSNIPYEEIIDDIKKELIGFKRLKKTTELEPGCYIKYIKKKSNCKSYGGFFKQFKGDDIIELYTKGRKWMIYRDDSYIFYKYIERKNNFRKMLNNFLDNFDIQLN